MYTDDCPATLKIPGYDTVDIVRRVQPGTGHARYQIHGRRVTGVVVLIPRYEFADVDPDTQRVIVQFGDCDPNHEFQSHNRRDHLPECNSVQLAGHVILHLP